MSNFQLPIAYLSNKTRLEPELLADLELLDSTEESPPLYTHVLGDRGGKGKRTFDMWSQYYTSDRAFLKDHQTLLKRGLPSASDNAVTEGVNEIWSEVNNRNFSARDADGFHDKYQYIDWPSLKWLNCSSVFLACLSAYNIGSPVFSLATPIFIMLVPFVILRLRGKKVSVPDYITVLKYSMRSHALGKLFQLGSATIEQKFYIAISLAFYVFQVYQNVCSCRRFCKNMSKVRKDIIACKAYLTQWSERVTVFETTMRGLESFTPFANETRDKQIQATKLATELPDLKESDPFLERAMGIGSTMKAFYQIHQDPKMKEVLGYALDWDSYIENLREIGQRLKSKRIRLCKLNKKKTRFVGAFFPASGEDPVRNTYSMDKHLLVTGPNAAGKTTILKASLFNILLSQQFGGGFYESAKVAPFDRIHCYINIPDTGGRDSLFQAEARRCRDILSCIEDGPKHARHFCVFDELYSGTNPYEAIGSAEAFLRHIGKSPRVSFIMTTHFLELCARLGDHKRVLNKHMSASCGEEGMVYTYKMQEGVSKVKGGVEVLRELEYPESVLKAAETTVSELCI